MEEPRVYAEEHRDDMTAKIGMWIFLFTEILLFGGLFIVYSIYRYRNHGAFHLAAQELNVTIGTINTYILLIRGNRKLSATLVFITILLGLAFLINKYFEWGVKFQHGLYPGAHTLGMLSNGDQLFFTLYFAMTGLHALHIVAGMSVLSVIFFRILSGRIRQDKYVFLENGGLYWHLVDIIWIFLYPLFYLIT